MLMYIIHLYMIIYVLKHTLNPPISEKLTMFADIA